MNETLIDRELIRTLHKTLPLSFKQVQDIQKYISKSKVLGFDTRMVSDNCSILENAEEQVISSDRPIILINRQCDVRLPTGLFEGTQFKTINLAGTKVGTNNTSFMFSGCGANEIHLEGIDTSEVVYMSSMFATGANDSDMEIITMDGIITSKTQYINNMFESCWNLRYISMKNSDISNIKDMQELFYDCENLEEIDGLDVLDLNSKDILNLFGAFHKPFIKIGKETISLY